jgi:methionyl-tRNA synthetase
LLDAGSAGYTAVGELLERNQQKAALAEAMRVVGEANKYLSDQAPWKLRESEPERYATVLHTALQLVSDCGTLLTPFLPSTGNQVRAMLGDTRPWSPMPDLVEAEDLDGGPGYPILTGAYAEGAARWERTPLPVGNPLDAPTPLFAKLDASVVDEELARLEEGAG